MATYPSVQGQDVPALLRWAATLVQVLERRESTLSLAKAYERLPIYNKLALPDPTRTGAEGGLVYVRDEVGGATLAFSDGVNWRRVQDRVVVS